MISWRQIISGSAGPIFASIFGADNQSGPLFDISKDVAMATNFGQNLRNDLHSAPGHFRMGCTIVLWMRALIAPLIALHPVNMVKIGSVVFELKWGSAATRPKLAYIAEYLNNYWTSLYQRFSIGRCIYVDYKTDVSFAVVKGTLLW